MTKVMINVYFLPKMFNKFGKNGFTVINIQLGTGSK